MFILVSFAPTMFTKRCKSVDYALWFACENQVKEFEIIEAKNTHLNK